MTDCPDVRALIADWMRDRFDGWPLDASSVVMDRWNGMEIRSPGAGCRVLAD